MKAEASVVLKTRLANGLEVCLKEMPTAPLISTWIWYRVGSRQERAGWTGASHWVEHMLFKGTPTYPAGVIDRVISRHGGIWNALTNLDWTTYFQTVPADRVDLTLEIEADRMTNSVFGPVDVESERTVIISERQGNENDPTFRLSEEVQASAFRVHPYHHEVIGDMADLQAMDRDALVQHYRRYYTPGNAVLTMAGAFKSRPMLKKIRKHFGELPRQADPQRRVRPEPPQLGERRVTVEGPGETAFLEVAYRAPRASDPDFMTLVVLDTILAGASSLAVFAAPIPNATSRLYRSLVEKGLAAAVAGNLAATIDPFLYTLHITVRPDRDPAQVLKALDKEIDRLLQGPIEKAELLKASKQSRALFAYGSESITNQAFWLGFSEMFAEYRWFEGYLERLAATTCENALALARRVFVPSQRVVGLYLPSRNGRHG